MILEQVKRLQKSSYWKDIAWLVSGNAIAQLIGILSLPLLTRLYSPSDFAIQTLFMQVMGFLTVIITLRYEFFIQLPKENFRAKELIILVTLLAFIGSVITTPIFWLFQGEIAEVLGDAALAPWLVYVPLSAALLSISLAIQHYIQRLRDYRRSSLSELISKGVFMTTALVGFWLIPKPAGLILAQAAGSVGKILFLIRAWKCVYQKRAISGACFKVSKINFKQLQQNAKEYLHLSGSLVFSHLMLSFTAIIPTVFIAHQYGSNTLGQFSLVIVTIYLPSGLIGKAIGQVYYQRAAERWNQGSNFINFWNATAKKLIVVGLPLYVIVAVLAPVVYPLIFGDMWEEAGQFARLLAVSGFFSFITSPLDRACIIVGAWWYAPLWHTSRAITAGLVAWIASYYSLDVKSFTGILVFQMTLLYLVDYWSEWRFAHRQPGKK